MARRLRNRRRSGLMLAIYVVCMALVLSFILFEVLDIDGSDFPARPNSAAIPNLLAEASHDIRRTLARSPLPSWIDLAVLFGPRWGVAVQRQGPAGPPSARSLLVRQRRSRAPLPRESLPAQPA